MLEKELNTMVEKDARKQRQEVNNQTRDELIFKMAEQINTDDFEQFQEYLKDLGEAVQQLNESTPDAHTYPQESARALGRINAVLEKINHETRFGSLAWQFCQLDKEFAE